MRRATTSSTVIVILRKNFYPRSPCGERLASAGRLQIVYNFYPRSPCGERPAKHTNSASKISISIHALLAESDLKDYMTMFQTISNFYPRSPCGERQLANVRNSPTNKFLSTLSLRRATRCTQTFGSYKDISIHALLAESDRRSPHCPCGSCWHFYPRSPCGERRV